MHKNPDAYNTRWPEYSFGQMLEDVRGPGLLGVAPSDDWIGVRGRWTCEAYRFDASRVGPWTVGDYDVVPMADLEALQEVYAERSRRAAAHVSYLASSLPTNNALPTVYFVGEGRGLPHDRRGEALVGEHFVCGAARLTADEPPQISWTWVVENMAPLVGYEDFVIVINAVQLGGRGSHAGLFGVRGNVQVTRVKANGQNYRHLYLYQGRGVGGVWMWKEEDEEV